MEAADTSLVLAALYAGDAVGAAEMAQGELDIFEAAALGRAERLGELLEQQPQLAQSRTADGFTALHLTAFFAGDPESARLLLESGAEPNAVADNAMRVTPINSAAARGHTGVVRVLLRHGAAVNAATVGGYSALHAAALHGDAELVDVLLGAGADPTAGTDDGRTPSGMARESGHEALAAGLQAAAAEYS